MFRRKLLLPSSRWKFGGSWFLPGVSTYYRHIPPDNPNYVICSAEQKSHTQTHKMVNVFIFYFVLLVCMSLCTVLLTEICVILRNSVHSCCILSVTRKPNLGVMNLRRFTIYKSLLSHICSNTKLRTPPTCSCKRGEQTIDHIIFDCELVEKERDRLKAAVLRSENWPVNKHTLINKIGRASCRERV